MKTVATLIITLGFAFIKVTAQLPSLIDTTNGWDLVWSDEFDYPNNQLEDNWVSQNSASGGVVLCSRWRENAEVHDGILELKAIQESRGGQDWTCGNVWTDEEFGYGYFECRYKYAGATGTNNSFWLWPYYGVPSGEKAFELDINEGHYPNIINTNIHNWTDTYTDGSHPQDHERFTMGGVEPQSGYTHILETPVTTSRIRFSSTHSPHFHIGEFRIYAPNASGYPENEVSETADTDVAELVNYSRDAGTTFSASGQYVAGDGRSTDPENVADGQVAPSGKSWIAQANGDKWLEITLDSEQEVGCIQFTNGWYGGSLWNALINNYKLEYHNGTQWVEIASFDIANGTDFSEEYHTYGFLWTDSEFRFYFDGEQLRSETHTLCHSETHILLSLAILDMGIAGAVTDDIDGTSMKIDYVRFYKYNNQTSEPDSESELDSNTLSANNTSEKAGIVFPNPVEDYLHFSPQQQFSKMHIYNSLGQLVLSSSGNNMYGLNVSILSSGLYRYKIIFNNSMQTGSFIKK